MKMKLPPEVQFHEDIRLLIYRPRGLIDEAAINKIIAVIEDIEAATQEPFNRFSDTSETHEVELNFRYHSGFSLSPPQLPRPPANQVCDSCDRFHHYSLRQAACLADSRFADQGPHFPRSTGSGAMARRADRTVNAGCRRNGGTLIENQAVEHPHHVEAVKRHD
jgi:hypothetical protein